MSAELIDALFDRTVDIVQSLPKTGPIQTSYEEKLSLYSLYKQATEGDVQSKRPGMLDMLGRAKWDAWAKRRGLGSQDAKQLYVESMLRILRKFSDRPQAVALIQELESFSGDVAQRVMSGSFAQSGSDSSSGSSRGRSPPLVVQQGPGEVTSDSEDDLPQRPPLLTPSVAQSRQSSDQALRSTASSTTGRNTPRSAMGPPAAPVRRYGPGSISGQPSSERLYGAPSVASATASRGTRARADSSPSDTPTGSDDEGYERPGALPGRGPAYTGRLGPGSFAPPGAAPQRYGTPGSWSHQQHMARPPSAGPGGRPPSAGPDPRFYSGQPPQSVQRFPPPPPSDSNAGAAHFYSTAQSPAPSSAQPQQQHPFYRPPESLHSFPAGGPPRANYPPSSSSVGRGPLSVGGPPPASQAPPAGAGPVRPEVDQALQSIQASLAALHERLNRVESARSSGGLYGGLGGFGQRGGRRGALRVVYVALSNAVHDIAVLLHLRDPSSSSRRNSPHALAPSYLAQSGGSGANGKGNYGSGAGGAGSGDGGGILGAPVRLALAILNLVVRLALDVTSLAVLVSLLLAIVYRLTGRGDPLIVLRLARRWGRFRSTRAVAGPPAAVGTS